MSKSTIEVTGAMILSFLNALVNLKIYAGEKLADDFELYKPDKWYPLIKFQELFGIIDRNFENPVPIKEQLGVESMNIWYNQGPGKDIIKRSVDFLHFQTSSEGYYSVIRGDGRGDFVLESIDEKKGKAVIVSSTPFSRDMERGVLLGGINLMEDLNYVDVNNNEDSNRFIIEFH